MAACEGSHFFIRYAEVGGLLTDLGTGFHRLLRGCGRFVKRVTISLSESGRRLFSGCRRG